MTSISTLSSFPEAIVAPRSLTKKEIEGILDFIMPQKGIPRDTAISIVENIKKRYRSQLVSVKVYPEIIDKLKEKIKQDYFSSLIQAGESVGIIGAQSIGEKNTQTTLNSVEWNEKIFTIVNKRQRTVPIGHYIDHLLSENKKHITHIEENRTEYLDIKEKNHYIPSCDENGMVGMYRIEAVTRHLPVGDLVKIQTKSGRSVTATQSKSFLVWNGEKFIHTEGSAIKIGDIVPVTRHLRIDEKHLLNTSALDRNFAFVCGIFASIAVTKVNKNNMHMYIQDSNIISRIEQFCRVKGYRMYKSSVDSETGTSIVTIETTTNELLNNMLYICGLVEKCNVKSIYSKAIFLNNIVNFSCNLDVDFLLHLLDGYMSMNLYYSYETNSLHISCDCEDTANSIYSILARLNIFCDKISNECVIHGKDIYTLSSLGFTSQSAKTHIETALLHIDVPPTFATSEDRDVYFDSVISVEYIKDKTEEYVYDLTVEHTRNFQLWNGLNVADTFHKAGMSEKTMTSGVPRFQELLNATKNPNTVNYRIYFEENNHSIQELRKQVNFRIAGLTLSNLCTSIEVCMNKKTEKWYEAYKIISQDDRFSEHEHCVTLKLNMSKLFEFSLTMKDIVDCIHSEYGDMFCVYSPPSFCQIDIFINTETIELPADRILFVNKENATEIFMEECVQPIIEKLCVCGIPGISEIFFSKDEDTEEWLVETNSINSKKISSQYSSFKRLLALDFIDMPRTISNNIWDIYEILGIEATREFLIEEFESIMEGINKVHIELLVDRMTYNGSISSISRYTLRKDESGPMCKASFEETMVNFLKASSQGDTEYTRGVSASIICGKTSGIGTGMSEVHIDIPNLCSLLQKKDEECCDSSILPLPSIEKGKGEGENVSVDVSVDVREKVKGSVKTGRSSTVKAVKKEKTNDSSMEANAIGEWTFD